VEARLLALGCPKLNVQIRAGNDAVLAFYERLGFTPDGAAGLGRRLIPDD
jgi:RimJ/RimL family protein N-acetyltransferase